MKRVLVAVAVMTTALLTSAAAVASAASNSQLSKAALGSLNGSGTDGVARLHLVGTELTVEVFVDGLAPGAHAEHVHMGSCAVHPTPPVIVFDLPDLVPNAAGHAHSKAVIENVTAIPASEWYINVHSTSVDSSAAVACGNVVSS